MSVMYGVMCVGPESRSQWLSGHSPVPLLVTSSMLVVWCFHCCNIETCCMIICYCSLIICVVDDVNEMFGIPTEYLVTCPEDIIFMDGTGSNTN